MTYEEALEKLKYLIGGESDQYPPDYDIPIQVAIEALEHKLQCRKCAEKTTQMIEGLQEQIKQLKEMVGEE